MATQVEGEAQESSDDQIFVLLADEQPVPRVNQYGSVVSLVFVPKRMNGC